MTTRNLPSARSEGDPRAHAWGFRPLCRLPLSRGAVFVLGCHLSAAALVGATADSGVALAYPVEGITIDGDLSDWPDTLPRFTVDRHVWHEPSVEEDDCRADFRAGYNLEDNALYFAIAVRDLSRLGPLPDLQRHWPCEVALVWLALPHPSPAVRQIGFCAFPGDGTGGMASRTPGSEALYSMATPPPGAEYSTDAAGTLSTSAPAHYEWRCRRDGDDWWCEYRIDVGKLTGGQHRLQANEAWRVNVLLVDVDERDGRVKQTAMAWMNSGIYGGADAHGCLWLVGEPAAQGMVTGRVRLGDGRAPGTRKPVRLERCDDPQSHVRAMTDREGRFSAPVPAGRYRVGVDQRGFASRSNLVVTVTTGGKVDVDLVAPPVTGRVEAAGSGRWIPAGRGTRRGAWRVYGVADGLPEATVRAIAPDGDGGLWLASERGELVHFDGARFRVFTVDDGLPAGAIRWLILDSRGDPWFGAGWFKERQGVTRYDRAGDRFITYDTADAWGLEWVSGADIDAEGHLWLATAGTVSRWDDERRQFVQYTTDDGLPGSVVRTVHVGRRSGRVWVSIVGGGGIAYAQEGRFVSHPCRVVVPELPVLLEDRDDRLWAAGGERRLQEDVPFLWRDREAHRRDEALNGAEGWPSDPVLAMAEDAAGTIWLVRERGLSRVVAGCVEDVGAATGLGDETVLAVAPDHEGRLWIGVQGGGLRCLDPAWETFGTKAGLPAGAVRALAEWEGRLLVGTAQGLVRFSPGGTDAVERLTDWPVDALDVDSQGRLWVSSTWGLRVLDRTGREVLGELDSELGSRAMHGPQAVEEDARGRIWMAFRQGGLGLHGDEQRGQWSEIPEPLPSWVVTEEGESRLPRWWSESPFGFTVFRWTVLDGLPSPHLTALARGSGEDLWIGTATGGVIRHDGKRFQTFGPGDGLAGKSVRDIVRDDAGRLWFATGSGLSSFDGAQWCSYRRAEGLPIEDLRCLRVDRQGRLWMGTAGAGVVVFDPGLGLFQTLSWRDGLSHDTVNALWEDRGGNLWIGTEDGLSRYRPQGPPPRVRITGIRADGVPLPSAGVELVGQPRRLVFEFEGVSLRSHPDTMVYRCELRGYDTGERSVYEGRVEYTGVAVGEYEFRVRAVDQALLSSRGAGVRVLVRRDYGALAMAGGGGLAVVGGLVAAGFALKHRRERNRALIERAQSLEAAKEAADSANRAKSVFLANLSHEIRTPMNAILGYAQLLQRDVALSPSERFAVTTIARSGDHLLALINDVLDLSKIEAGRMDLRETDFDLNALIADLDALFRMRCQEKGLTWRTESALQGECWVRGDQGKLRQVLTNLLGNAVKFTEHGDVALILALPAAAGERAEMAFEVSDTGPGIPQAAKEWVFEPFQQTPLGERKGGAGLGLAIARRYAELMGGRLTLESSPGEGAHFRFRVPLAPTAPRRACAPRFGGEGGVRLSAGRRVRALVVDDVEENRDVLRQMLAQLGCDVQTAAGGREGLEMACAGAPDIAYLDIRMPDLDGLTVATEIRRWFDAGDNGQGRPRPRLVALSASALAHEQDRYRAAGFEGFVSKPIRWDALCQTLAMVEGVRFETDLASPVPRESRADFTAERPRLPRVLRERLIVAARLYRSTELKQVIAELPGLGPAGRELAVRLLEWHQAGHLDRILECVTSLEEGTTDAAGEPSPRDSP